MEEPTKDQPEQEQELEPEESSENEREPVQQIEKPLNVNNLIRYVNNMIQIILILDVSWSPKITAVAE